MSYFCTHIQKSTARGDGWVQGTITNVVVTLALAAIALARLKSSRYETRVTTAVSHSDRSIGSTNEQGIRRRDHAAVQSRSHGAH